MYGSTSTRDAAIWNVTLDGTEVYSSHSHNCTKHNGDTWTPSSQQTCPNIIFREFRTYNTTAMWFCCKIVLQYTISIWHYWVMDITVSLRYVYSNHVQTAQKCTGSHHTVIIHSQKLFTLLSFAAARWRWCAIPAKVNALWARRRRHSRIRLR